MAETVVDFGVMVALQLKLLAAETELVRRLTIESATKDRTSTKSSFWVRFISSSTAGYIMCNAILVSLLITVFAKQFGKMQPNEPARKNQETRS